MSEAIEARAAALVEAYLGAEGLGSSVSSEIHPGDDMLHVLERHGETRARARLLYFLQGRESFRAVEHALATAGIPWSGVEAFLEFACGYGRFTRFLVTRLPPERITTSDLLPEAVRFVAERFGTAALLSELDPEQLHFPRRYDVIWVGSLFSHLPRRRFEDWLRVLYAQLTPRGVMLFTTHAWEVCPEPWRNDEGFAFAGQSETRELDVQEYGSTYVQQRVVEEIAARAGVAHLRSLGRDLWTTQDLHCASRVARPGLEHWTTTPTARGALALEIEPHRRHARALGWVRLPASRTPVRAISLLLDGRDVGRALLGPPIVHRAADERSEALHGQELFLEGPLPELARGEHTLAAVVEDARGESQCFEVVSFE
jgi:SAM-dependent methyltransferase